jgi:hypothetical protein
MTDLEKELTEALRGMLSEFGLTVAQAWGGIQPTEAEIRAMAAIARAEARPVAWQHDFDVAEPKAEREGAK